MIYSCTNSDDDWLITVSFTCCFVPHRPHQLCKCLIRSEQVYRWPRHPHNQPCNHKTPSWPRLNLSLRASHPTTFLLLFVLRNLVSSDFSIKFSIDIIVRFYLRSKNPNSNAKYSCFSSYSVDKLINTFAPPTGATSLSGSSSPVGSRSRNVSPRNSPSLNRKTNDPFSDFRLDSKTAQVPSHKCNV